MALEKFSTFLSTIIDNALDTFELISEETTKARINGLQRNLLEDLTRAELEDISINPSNLYQHLRHHNAITIGKNIVDEMDTLKRLGQSADAINDFLTTNLPGYDEEKLASTFASIEKATRK